MTKTVINPKYQLLEEFIKGLPLNFDESGDIIYSARNTIKTIDIGEYTINVKSFKKPIFINQMLENRPHVGEQLRQKRHDHQQHNRQPGDCRQIRQLTAPGTVQHRRHDRREDADPGNLKEQVKLHGTFPLTSG